VAEIKRTIKMLGTDFPATEVPIVRRSEIPSEFELEDGTIIRVSTPVTAVLRLDGFPDFEGNPMFWVKNGTVVTVIAGPREKTKPDGRNPETGG
jgi:hypothetical protein